MLHAHFLHLHLITQEKTFKNKIIKNKFKYFYCIFTAQTKIRLPGFHVYIQENV